VPFVETIQTRVSSESMHVVSFRCYVHPSLPAHKKFNKQNYSISTYIYVHVYTLQWGERGCSSGTLHLISGFHLLGGALQADGRDRSRSRSGSCSSSGTENSGDESPKSPEPEGPTADEKRMALLAQMTDKLQVACPRTPLHNAHGGQPARRRTQTRPRQEA
jgi:hypothetical protein